MSTSSGKARACCRAAGSPARPPCDPGPTNPATAFVALIGEVNVLARAAGDDRPWSGRAGLNVSSLPDRPGQPLVEQLLLGRRRTAGGSAPWASFFRSISLSTSSALISACRPAGPWRRRGPRPSRACGLALIWVVRNAATRPHPTATTIRIRFFCFMVLPLGDKKTLAAGGAVAAACPPHEGMRRPGLGSAGTPGGRRLPATRPAGAGHPGRGRWPESDGSDPVRSRPVEPIALPISAQGRSRDETPSLADLPGLCGVAALLPRLKIRPRRAGYFSLSGLRGRAENSQLNSSIAHTAGFPARRGLPDFSTRDAISGQALRIRTIVPQVEQEPDAQRNAVGQPHPDLPPLLGPLGRLRRPLPVANICRSPMISRNDAARSR